MTLMYERMVAFVRLKGRVIAYLGDAGAILLTAEKPDAIALAVLHADEYEVAGQRYSKTEFEHLMNRLPMDLK